MEEKNGVAKAKEPQKCQAGSLNRAPDTSDRTDQIAMEIAHPGPKRNIDQLNGKTLENLRWKFQLSIKDQQLSWTK